MRKNTLKFFYRKGRIVKCELRFDEGAPACVIVKLDREIAGSRFHFHHDGSGAFDCPRNHFGRDVETACAALPRLLREGLSKAFALDSANASRLRTAFRDVFPKCEISLKRERVSSLSRPRPSFYAIGEEMSAG